MLKLPDVTLVILETLEHELGRLAVSECLRNTEFAEVLIFTDKPQLFLPLNCAGRFIEVPCWPDKLGWCRSLWVDVPPHLRTTHALIIQWDSWIWCADRWNDEFLRYDVIGAPWHWHKINRVGNSGFSLRSARLMNYLLNHRDKFPCVSTTEDDLLCRRYRPLLEDIGFEWAPERLACEFAFECSRPAPDSKHWGFHGAFNFGAVLDHDRLIERAKLMQRSPYISKSYMWEAFKQTYPAVIAELQQA